MKEEGKGEREREREREKKKRKGKKKKGTPLLSKLIGAAVKVESFFVLDTPP